ncbi:MAG: nucleoside recognition domain-containing protein [Candidatus Marinimicrobia bacterium]|nr:nucleoside recognition domain-containing protein [Candidatus Neomarinimicrobiota bacterium]
MINTVWLLLLSVGIIVAGFSCLGIEITSAGWIMEPSWQPLMDMTGSVFEEAKHAVTLALKLVGVMALWLGIMKIAEKSGLVKAIARGLKPIMVWLFPEVPADHPAMGSIIMAIAASMLGLGNAATPLGLKAIGELQKLNKIKDTATNAMCTFMAMSTSSVTIIPATIVGIRAAANSTNATEIIGPVIVATGISTTVAIIMSKLLQKLPRYQLKNIVQPANINEEK